MKTTIATIWRGACDKAGEAPKHAVHGILRGYKAFVSPMFGGSCRFLPSCADYADEAVARHGVIRGGLLAAGRVMRCHPLCKGGHDPVPPARHASHPLESA